MLKHLRRQSVTLYNSSAKDRYGRDTFGAGSTEKVRLNEKTRNIFKPNGETITILANCYMRPDVTISIDDKVTYDGNDYKVFSKKIVRDDKANTHHVKVELIKWQA